MFNQQWRKSKRYGLENIACKMANLFGGKTSLVIIKQPHRSNVMFDQRRKKLPICIWVLDNWFCLLKRELFKPIPALESKPSKQFFAISRVEMASIGQGGTGNAIVQ